MAAFGEYLRHNRVERGISLHQIADSTRISVRLLEALEGEQFDLLPGGVFNLSFVRQYCREVGLDEDDTIERFKRVAGHTTAVAYDHLAVSARSRGTVGSAGARVAESVADYTRRHGNTVAGLFAAVLLLVGGLFFYSTLDANGGSAETQQQRQQQTQQTARGPAPGQQVVPRATLTSSRPRDTKPIRLELQMTEEVWVRAHADGERVLEATLRPGDTRRIEADKQVRLRVGNAGGLKVALNGKPMPPIGPRGHVRNAVITAGGLHVVQPPPAVDSEADGGDSSSSETQTSESLPAKPEVIASLVP